MKKLDTSACLILIFFFSCAYADASAKLLSIAPGSGQFTEADTLDLTLKLGSPSAVTGGRIILDGEDVTELVVPCLEARALNSLQTFSCPGLKAGVLGLGSHSFSVSLVLANGMTVSDSVNWQVTESAVPTPTLAIAPGTGDFDMADSFDLILELNSPTAITGGRITLDGEDVTELLAPCLEASELNGVQILTCSGVSAKALGLGTHAFSVSLILANGLTVSDSATWQVSESAVTAEKAEADCIASDIIEADDRFSAEEETAHSATAGSITLRWNIPLTRVNGEALSASELRGYELYVTSEQSRKCWSVTIDDPSTTEHTLSNLEADIYHFAISAYDLLGLYSEMSKVVSIRVGEVLFSLQ